MKNQFKCLQNPQYRTVPCQICKGQLMFCGNRLCEDCGGSGKMALVGGEMLLTKRGLFKLEEDIRG